MLHSEEKISIIKEDLNYDSDDSNITSKRRRIDTVDGSDTDTNIHNTSQISRYIRIMKDENNFQDDLFQFVEESGSQHLLPTTAKPIEYFNLFFTDSLWTIMVEETNRYAEELLSQSTTKHASRMVNWYPVTVVEMKAFVAVLMEMGITKKPTIYSYWTSNSRAIPWFKRMFPRNRFQNILRCFHLVDNQKCFPPEHEEYDPCAKFYPIIAHANYVFQTYYIPHKMLSISESSVGTHCHSKTTHLTNKKHHKWGIKFWMLSDAVSKYCISFHCTRGAKSKISKEGLGYDVVEKLLQDADRLNKGHHLYVNKFFTSTNLAKFLFSKNTYLTGAIGNVKEIPNEAKQLEVGEAKYFRNEEVLLCAYREKKTSKNPTLIISTEATSGDVTIINKHSGRVKQKIRPHIINSYNNFMSGADESDKMLYAYLDERRTLTYWKKVTFNVLSRMVLNSYLLYKENVGKQAMSRLQYTSDLITEIEYEWTQTTDKFNKMGKITYGLEKLPGRNLRRCIVCSTKNTGIRRSNLICTACKKGVHALCLANHCCKF